MMIHQDLLDAGKIEERVSGPWRHPMASWRRGAYRGRLFREEHQAHALPRVSPQGLFVGTGVIEAGCKTVIGSRSKPSGMFWTVREANAILALPCWQINARFNGKDAGPPDFHFHVVHP
jgi:hypothetical protein